MATRIGTYTDSVSTLVSNNVKKLRKARKLTTTNMSHLLSSDLAFLYKIESGRRCNPQLDTLCKIALILDVPVAILCTTITPSYLKTYAERFTNGSKHPTSSSIHSN